MNLLTPNWGHIGEIQEIEEIKWARKEQKVGNSNLQCSCVSPNTYPMSAENPINIT